MFTVCRLLGFIRQDHGQESWWWSTTPFEEESRQTCVLSDEPCSIKTTCRFKGGYLFLSLSLCWMKVNIHTHSRTDALMDWTFALFDV